MLSLKSIPIPEPSVASRIMDGEAVLVHPQRGKVKVLNAVGAEIWKRLDGHLSIGEIINQLSEIYSVERATLENDALTFLTGLLERDLISTQDSPVTA